MDTIEIKFTTQMGRYTTKGCIYDEINTHTLDVDRDEVIELLSYEDDEYYENDDPNCEATTITTIYDCDSILGFYYNELIQIPFFNYFDVDNVIYNFYKNYKSTDEIEIRIVDMEFTIKNYTDVYQKNEDLEYKVNYKNYKDYYNDIYWDVSEDKPKIISKMGIFSEDLKFLGE
jgi:hypothetical protein